MKKFARYKKSGIAVLISILPLSASLFAQSDSLQRDIALPEATILEKRFNRTGYTAWQADSLPELGVLSLSNRLFWENGLDVRQNGPGTLATISARGAGPNRTPVLWNGLNLQSPMNGVTDAALLPLWSGDQVEVVQGGNSAAQSSGAMGGTVLIESPLRQMKRGVSGQLGFEGGSFGAKALQGSADYGSERFSGRLRGQWQRADNDFPFQKTGLDGRPFTTRQENNFADRADVQQFNQLIINKKNLLKTALWIQRAFRRIPPTATEAASDIWQRDRSGRGVASWEYSPGRHSKLQTRVAWQDEYIGFHFAGATEESRAQTALAAVEWHDKSKDRFAWRFGTSAQHVRAASDGYKEKDKRYTQARVAGFATGEYSFSDKGKVSLLLRQEWVEDQSAPFTWTLGWEIPFRQAGLLRGHFSRNFNLPTFNDRFWETLDNSELAPEKGYSADLGWIFDRSHFRAEIAGFQLILDDWILWQPGDDGIFRPGNLRKVNSRGVEAAATLKYRFRGFNWKLKARVQGSQTENVAVYSSAISTLNKQLPYTPKISGGGGLWVERAGFSGAYLHQATGSRFVSTDNKGRLPAYQTGTLLLRYDLSSAAFWHWKSKLAFDVMFDNIWDVSYESLINRPMPGRNWRAGFLLGW